MTDKQQLDLFEFEPIKGYPMLNWKGKRPFTNTQYYPAQLKERHGEEVDGWMNKIYWGDNLQVMSHLLNEYRGKVNLVYIDPPFDSKADYKKKISLKGKQVSNDQNNFEEKQYTDIWTNDEYLQFMYERLILIRELLSDDGSIYIHCDYHKSHYLRCILEEIFGVDNFINELIWKRTTARSDQRTYNHIHDVIFFYAKSYSKITWNQLFTAYDKEKILKQYKKEGNTGRLYQAITLIVPGTRNGSSGKAWRGIDPSADGNHWKYPIEKLDQLDNEGQIYWPPKGNVPRLKQYLDKMHGVPIQSIWDDIVLSSNSSERLDYPTQKPEALLERIIKASSNPSDIIFDCFMGSGTTQTVALKLGRRFIGADINLGAVQITSKRLLKIAFELNQQQQQTQLNVTEEEPITYHTGFELYNVNHYDVFRNPLEAKELLLDALEVQKLAQANLFDGEKDGRMVKIMPVNRITTRADLSELIKGFDYKAFNRRQAEEPNKPVEKITLICMGHEPDLGAVLKQEVEPFNIDVEVVDVLRDRQDLQFKRDSEAQIEVKGQYLAIEKFYPMNLLSKLSLEQEKVDDWRELVESIMIDWNYDGAILEPAMIDIPDKNELVKGKYEIPEDAGTIRVKITDLLSESLEMEIQHG